ncbi:MAG: glycosyltransferase, partial [Mucilaginibacter sp.]
VHLKSTFNYVAIARLLFNGKYKTILHDHSGDHDKFGSKVSLSARYILRPQYYIGVTEKLHQWAVSELGIPEKRTFTLVNTIIPNEKIVFNQKSGLNKAFLISNIRATKNIEFAIDLFNTLSWSLSIFGNNFADSAYYNKIMNYPRTDKIEIVEGVYDFSEIYDQYAFAVHTAKSESGPLVLLEYLAYGIPFLAYRTGEIAEKIHGELPEYFVDSFDVDRWVEKIEVVRSKTDTGEKFKWIFHKYFGPEKYANNCLDIYNAIDLDGR